MIHFIFTFCIWLVFALVLVSNPRNPVNRVCFAAGMLFSLGVFKEFLLYDFAPFLQAHSISVNGIRPVYSIMTSLLYFGAMPVALIFALYLCDFPGQNRAGMRAIYVGVTVVMLGMMLVFPPPHTQLFQQTSPVFWIVCTVYNLTYGILFAGVMLRSVTRESRQPQRRQKRWICFALLPPIWYWLITIFVIHTLRLEQYYKLWQGNALLLGLVLLFYIVMAFREGMMGLRLRRETYRWNTQALPVGDGIQYFNHTLKGEIVKLEWCIHSIKYATGDSDMEELSMMERSLDRLRHYLNATHRYVSPLELHPIAISAQSLIAQCLEGENGKRSDQITIGVDPFQDFTILCDPIHMTEVLHNLIRNAADALNDTGRIIIRCRNKTWVAGKMRWYHIISVTDSGCGIPKKECDRIFDPYYTGKNSANHAGLGLFYCNQVMLHHHGFIALESREGHGSTFSLYFPVKRYAQ